MSTNVSDSRLGNEKLLESCEGRELTNDILGRCHGVGEFVWKPFDRLRRLYRLVIKFHRCNLGDEVLVQVHLYGQGMSVWVSDRSEERVSGRKSYPLLPQNLNELGNSLLSAAQNCSRSSPSGTMLSSL